MIEQIASYINIDLLVLGMGITLGWVLKGIWEIIHG